MQILQVLDGADPFARPLDGRTLVVGSAEDAGLRLTSKGVARRHLAVEFVGSEPWVRALDGKVTVNGRAVDRAALALGDRIEVGQAVLVLATSVARARGPADVLEPVASSRSTSRAPRARQRGSSKLVPIAAALVVGGGALAFALLGSGGYSLPPGFAELDRLRRAGSFELARQQLHQLESWATDEERKVRLQQEVAALDGMVDRVERRKQAVLAQSGERSYAEFVDQLKLEERSAKDEQDRIAARIVRGGLAELLQGAVAKMPPPREPEAKPAAVEAPKPAVVETPSQPAQPVTPSPTGPATDTPVAEAPRANSSTPSSSSASPSSAADATVSADDVHAVVAAVTGLVAKGEFLRAFDTLQMAIAGADASEQAKLSAQLAELRQTAVVQAAVVAKKAQESIAQGRYQEAHAELESACARFPDHAEFAMLPTLLAQVKAGLAGGGPSHPGADAVGLVDEQKRRETLQTLAPALIAARTQEAAGDFGGAAATLAKAVDGVRAQDPDYATRLDARIADLRRVVAWHEAIVALAATQPVAVATAAGSDLRVVGDDQGRLRWKAAASEGSAGWHEVEPESVAALAALPGLRAEAVLGAASLLYRADARSRAEKVLAHVLTLDRALESQVWRTIAQGRGEPIDPRGYELRADGFVSFADAEAEKQAQKLLSKIDSALRSKNEKQRQAVIDEALALGPGAMHAVVARFRRLLDREVESIENSPLKKQIDKVAAQRELLDKARADAKALIYDEVKYFYPYKPPQVDSARYAEYVKVQAEVDRLVDAVRDLWNDQRVKFKVPANVSDALERLGWLSSTLENLGALDPLALAGLEWANALQPGETLDVRSYCRTVEEREARDLWRRIDAYNAIVCAQIDRGEADQLRITNEYRAMFGHRPLAVDLRLRTAAKGHAEEMSKLGYFSHFSPTPGRKTPVERMQLAQYTNGVGENIALNDGAEPAHIAWCHSSGHHRNLLNPNHTELGVGNDGRNWVQNFGRGEEYRQKLDEIQKPR